MLRRLAHCQYNESVHRKEQLATRINMMYGRNVDLIKVVLRSDGFNAISPVSFHIGAFCFDAR